MTLRDEREIIRRSLFLPLYFTVISLMVPLSLMAAWTIYSQPARYRSLFPHNEARQQAVAILLLTVLFFLPLLKLWLNVNVLLLLGALYAFLLVPLLVGLVKPSLSQQQIVIYRVKWNVRNVKRRLVSHLSRLSTSSRLAVTCVKELFKSLPFLYRKYSTFQLTSNQLMFLLLAQTVLDEEETSTALCLASSLLVYKVIGRQMEVVTSGEMILHSQTFYEPWLGCEEIVTGLVSGLQSDVLEELEHLYVPLVFRLLSLSLSGSLCLLSMRSGQVCLSLSSCYTNLYLPVIRLRQEVLDPLEEELKGLRVFRQPTKEELREGGDQCPVCLEVMHLARITPCGHIFHSHCLRQCLQRTNRCPYCRTVIKEETVK